MMSVFFFKQKTAYEMRISDWSSDVCSSDLKRVTDENIKALNAAYTGTWIVLGRDTYRIASVQRQYNTPTMVGVYVERLDHKGTVVGRTHTVLSPAGLAARVV